VREEEEAVAYSLPGKDRRRKRAGGEINPSKAEYGGKEKNRNRAQNTCKDLLFFSQGRSYTTKSTESMTNLRTREEKSLRGEKLVISPGILEQERQEEYRTVLGPKVIEERPPYSRPE